MPKVGDTAQTPATAKELENLQRFGIGSKANPPRKGQSKKDRR